MSEISLTKNWGHDDQFDKVTPWEKLNIHLGLFISALLFILLVLTNMRLQWFLDGVARLKGAPEEDNR